MKRRSIYEQRPAPKAAMVVDAIEGRVIGWQRDGEFVPIGQNCCENPLECRKCFRPVAPWWAPWR